MSGKYDAEREANCPQAHKHHKHGERLGYVAWHQWAEKMIKTHDQLQCQGCGLYKIWKRKPSTPA